MYYHMFFPSYTYSFYLGFTTALPKHFKYIISTAFFGAHLTLFVHAHLGHGSVLETEFGQCFRREVHNCSIVPTGTPSGRCRAFLTTPLSKKRRYLLWDTWQIQSNARNKTPTDLIRGWCFNSSFSYHLPWPVAEIRHWQKDLETGSRGQLTNYHTAISLHG